MFISNFSEICVCAPEIFIFPEQDWSFLSNLLTKTSLEEALSEKDRLSVWTYWFWAFKVEKKMT